MGKQLTSVTQQTTRQSYFSQFENPPTAAAGPEQPMLSDPKQYSATPFMPSAGLLGWKLTGSNVDSEAEEYEDSLQDEPGPTKAADLYRIQARASAAAAKSVQRHQTRKPMWAKKVEYDTTSKSFQELESRSKQWSTTKLEKASANDGNQEEMYLRYLRQ